MRGSHYTEAQNAFIRDHADMRLQKLADLYCQEFGEKITPAALGKKRHSLGLPPLPCANETAFTPETDAFLLGNWERMTSRELAGELAARFGIHRKAQTVTDRLNMLGVHRGNCFTPAGYLPRASKPIGYERVDKNRIVLVKVGQPNKWKPKAQLIMGHDPKKEQVIFLDGNPFNFDKDNLLVVSRRVHARLAKNGWLTGNGEVIRTGATWSELLYAIRDNAERNE